MAWITRERTKRAERGAYWCLGIALAGLGGAAVAARFEIALLGLVSYFVAGPAIVVGAGLMLFIFLGLLAS